MSLFFSVVSSAGRTVARPLPIPPIQFRIGFFNIYLGMKDIGGIEWNARERHIRRIGADIMGLSEIVEGDVPAIQNTLAPANGYDYTAFGSFLISGLQVALMSKYPILNSEVVQSISPANEFLRQPLYAELDIGHATKTLGVYVVHSESWCYAGPCPNEIRPDLEFKRAFEWIRMAEHWAAKKAANPNLEGIVMGDTNDDPESPQTVSFTEAPEIVEGWLGFVPSSTVSYPIAYAEYPRRQTQAMEMSLLESVNLDGVRDTLWTNNPNTAITVPGVHIDFIGHSGGITAIGHEVLDSEATQVGGLEKYGDALAFGDSRLASDHKCIFADCELT